MNRALKVLIGLAVAAAAVAIMVSRSQRLAHQTPTPPSGTQTSAARTIREAIQNASDGLLNATNSTEAMRVLSAFRNALVRTQHTNAVAALRTFLETGQDVPTHLGFKLNADGSLAEAPTLRTFLLDQLTTLDLAVAAALAKDILADKKSPDEWAVALRVCALADTNETGRVFVRTKVRELAQHEPWRVNPSVGFLEAFDVFMFTRDTGFVPELSDFARDKGNPAVAHAAFLTLDRLVQSDATPTLQTLLDHPDLLAGREETRASFFARADVRDSTQKELLARYLLAPERLAPELDAFAGLFPNANFMISHNLLTQLPTLSNEELRARDAAALTTINNWLADERFSSLRPQLTRIRMRLTEFVKPATR